jgi:hypothetical protein
MHTEGWRERWNEGREAVKRQAYRVFNETRVVEKDEDGQERSSFAYIVIKLVCLSSHATVSCMEENPPCPSALRQGRVLDNVYLKTLSWVRAVMNVQHEWLRGKVDCFEDEITRVE